MPEGGQLTQRRNVETGQNCRYANRWCELVRQRRGRVARLDDARERPAIVEARSRSLGEHRASHGRASTPAVESISMNIGYR